MKVWQIATGDLGRDNPKLSFDHDFVILAPGETGDAGNHCYAASAANSSEPQVYNGASIQNLAIILSYDFPTTKSLLVKYRTGVISCEKCKQFDDSGTIQHNS